MMSSTAARLVGRKLVLATHNDGKAREIERALDDLSVAVVTAGSLDLASPPETADTFAGNALIKARAAHAATGLPALADDSGLAVAALGGQPGVFTADWAGEPRDYARAFARLTEALGGEAAATGQAAAFECHLCLIVPGAAPVTAVGRCAGRLIFPPRGAGGFGYDPVFVPEGEARSFGEMSPEEKARFSHRARAVAALRADLGLAADGTP